MIWIRVLDMHIKSDTRTGRNPWLVTKSGLRLIAYLDQLIRIKIINGFRRENKYYTNENYKFPK